jgi:hypothetical protein
MPRSGAAVLSDYPMAFRLAIACDKCERAGAYQAAGLIERWGDIGLPELLGKLAADCPRRVEGRFYDQCGAFYPARVKA